MIAAYDMFYGIGREGTIPWRCKKDMANFKAKTMGNHVVMGRKTYDSLPKKSLPGRTLLVLSRRDVPAEGDGIFVDSLSSAVRIAKAGVYGPKTDTLWIAGGAEVYALAGPYVHEVDLTQIEVDGKCDTFFPFPANLKNDIRPRVKDDPWQPRDWRPKVLGREEGADGQPGFSIHVYERANAPLPIPEGV